MHVALIDADSKIPNLALMKLSAYHKQRGDIVDLFRVNMPYYPNRKKFVYKVPTGYDKVYCSVIFDGNYKYIKGDNIIFGGTGFSLDKTLPNNIESMKPDYSIYPKNKTSYGFITRGCIRKCEFCQVPEKEGYIRKVNNISDIIQHKKVKFMDNNILSYPMHKDILKQLIDINIKCQFNQGLDIRLIDDENSKLLSRLNYMGNYIFAFDDYKYCSIVKGKIKIMDWRKPFQFKFFVYIHPDMSMTNIIKRIEWLKTNKCLPYIMRHISCWDSSKSQFFIDLAAWCNQPGHFKKMSFYDFLEARYKKQERIEKSSKIYSDNSSVIERPFQMSFNY